MVCHAIGAFCKNGGHGAGAVAAPTPIDTQEKKHLAGGPAVGALVQQVGRLGELRAALSGLGNRLGRRLYQAPSPEAIQIQIDEEVREALERFCRGRGDAEAEEA